MAITINEDKLRGIIRESICQILTESTLNRIESYINDQECAILTAWRSTLKDVTKNTFMPKHISHRRGDRANKLVGVPFNVGEDFTDEEKKYYNRELKAKLLSLGYGVTQVRGSYRESGKPEGQEESLFIVNRNNDPNFKENIFKLSEYYNQDSFMYSPKGTSEGYLVGTNMCDFPGYGNEIPSGAFRKNVQSMFMSRIGNKGFSFTNGEKINKSDPNRNEKLDNGDNNYEDDAPMTFQDRKEKRVKSRSNKKDVSNESIERFLQIDTYENASIGAKHAIRLCAKGIIN